MHSHLYVFLIGIIGTYLHYIVLKLKINKLQEEKEHGHA